MKNIKIIPIKKLKSHEKTDRKNLMKVRQKIFNSDFFTEPIIVERNNFVILDGHHRTEILKNSGFSKIPTYLVNYRDKKIKVSSRRNKITISKEKIIQRALNNKPYPYKTSRHFIPNRPKGLKIELKKLL